MIDKDDLKSTLKESIIVIDFEKKDGTIRSMRCTLMEQFLPTPPRYIPIDAPKRKENPDVLAVWDLDINNWRSFRYDSIRAITVG
jgi:hypothetical protein